MHIRATLSFEFPGSMMSPACLNVKCLAKGSKIQKVVNGIEMQIDITTENFLSLFCDTWRRES